MGFASRIPTITKTITVDIILPASALLVETTVYSSLACVHTQDVSSVRIGSFEENFAEVEDTFIFSYPISTIPNNHTSAWIVTTAVAVGQHVAPTTENGFYYKATVAGTTGGSEPTWPTVLGGTVVDGTVTWTATTGILEHHIIRWGNEDHNIINVRDNSFPYRNISVKTQRSR